MTGLLSRFWYGPDFGVDGGSAQLFRGAQRGLLGRGNLFCNLDGQRRISARTLFVCCVRSWFQARGRGILHVFFAFENPERTAALARAARDRACKRGPLITALWLLKRGQLLRGRNAMRLLFSVALLPGFMFIGKQPSPKGHSCMSGIWVWLCGDQGERASHRDKGAIDV